MILLQTSKHSINQFKRTLTTPHHLINRTYSFESGRNRKPNTRTTTESQSSTSTTTSKNEKPKAEENPDQKPTIIIGHGRRHHRHHPKSNINTNSTNSTRTTNHHTRLINQRKLLLPFVPLPFDHLSHLKPKVLSLDRLFSLQRPLLEIELSVSERRSISLESRLESLSDSNPDESDIILSSNNQLDRDHITVGSPSDPSFKSPQSAHGHHLTDYGVDEGFEDDLWGAVDGYAPYLITEPDGIDPDWSGELKHYLATSSAFVPPPVPAVNLLDKVDHSSIEKLDDLKLTEEEQRIEEGRLQDIRFLAPYGTSMTDPTPTPTDSNDFNVVLEEDLQSCSSRVESGKLPEISQDPHSLMLQAARFLHSGLTLIRWPSVVEWETIGHQLRTAEKKFNSSDDQLIGKEEEIEKIKAVRGDEVSKHHKRSNRWLKLTIETDTKASEKVIKLDVEQINRIISYSESLIEEFNQKSKTKTKVEHDLVSDKDLMKRFERLGEFLVRKHHQRNQDGLAEVKFSISQLDQSSQLGGLKQIDKEEECNEIIRMDSVQRKRKRKMKVHNFG
ncbi:uncharacterized protein MELLADRAFT_88459 [Melampsora larici-populina 98AG31]|uniref:Uncharacterized protein n=1 Tax=Melampsora larici-populina (strain 98AG31 / pathotype 3-4-7) TaxID=747676 RepID=F4RRT3_MELLP|nr:uncharacterized protein MELLADRAFT_88459 [Melampsora larici-populina 98AG31]EGG04900.1 hypothetical protein MELLADRAFT_88459 [Melampsora larici-populina 98AG31]